MALRNKQKTYRFGIFAEKISLMFLRLKGYRILAWRYKSRFGEIDIIAKKSSAIVAIEVKARSSQFLIEEVLHPKQIERLKRSLEFFISKNPQFQQCDLRLDFIEFRRPFFLKHYKNFIS